MNGAESKVEQIRIKWPKFWRQSADQGVNGGAQLGMSDADPDPAPDSPADEKGWEELAKNILRAEMMKNGVSYATLAERLATLGITDNELNLRNKVSRGRFTAVFLMQCLKALDAEWIHIPPSLEVASGKGGAQTLARKNHDASKQ